MSGIITSSRKLLNAISKVPVCACKTLWKMGEDDPRRAIHGLKVESALTLVSLLYLLEPLFQGVGQNATWAVMTVVVVLKFTTGATLGKGLNRGLGTLWAGSLAFFIDFVAEETRQIGRAVFVGTSVFIIGFMATYLRFIPYIKKNYDSKPKAAVFSAAAFTQFPSIQTLITMADEVVAIETAAPVLGEPMDIMTALQMVLKKSLAHDGLVPGLHEAAKAIEKHAAQLCVLAEDCDQPDYVKLVKALCADHNVHLVTVPSAKTLGEWAGLCKIDSEGKARKVVGCSCLVIKDYGEESEGLNIVQNYVKSQ